jgi:hypothetical protein
VVTLRIDTDPVAGDEYFWSARDLGSGFVVIDLRQPWAAQADRAIPAGWQRSGSWDVSGPYATVEVEPVAKRATASKVDTSFPDVRARHRLDTQEALAALFAEMRADVAGRHEDGAKRLISAHWQGKLRAVLLEQNLATASDVGAKVAAAFESDFDPAVMEGWFEENARIGSENITAKAEDDIRAADDEDPVGHVFGILETTGAVALAASMVTTSANFAARDTAEKSGAATKTWRVTSSNPRASHAAMNGETVALSENFSNGLAWPGDPAGDADDNAECKCALVINR